MKPVNPATISDACRKRAEQLGVDPVDYRRWERGERIQAVSDAIDREAHKEEGDG